MRHLSLCVTVLLTIFWPAYLLALNMETVTVGDAGNAGEWSGQSYGGNGSDRICGSVGYTYNIGKYEVTSGQYTEFLNKVGGVDIYGLYNTGMANTSPGSGITRSGGGTVDNPYTYSVASDFANRPVGHVSYWDSCRFANWLHNGQPSGAQGAGTTETGAYTLNGYNSDNGQTIQRNADWKWAVTSEDEWYKAAYYKGGSTNAGYWDYPTSSNTAPGRDMNDASGNNANIYGTPYPIDSGKHTTICGEFQNSDSPYGTFDQGGNVWEWNEAIVFQNTTYSSRGMRGGSFRSSAYYTLASLRYYGDGYYFYPTYEIYNVGFRVSEVPEPSSLLLLALGGLAFIRRQRQAI